MTLRAISLEEAAKSQKKILAAQTTLPLVKENLAALSPQWSPSGSTQSIPCSAECSMEPVINALAIRPPSAQLRSETSSRRTSEASSVFEFQYGYRFIAHRYVFLMCARAFLNVHARVRSWCRMLDSDPQNSTINRQTLSLAQLLARLFFANCKVKHRLLLFAIYLKYPPTTVL